MEAKNDEIIVSVFCLAYNHEKYIQKTLDGFVGQKTSFRFEVLVHDDASTDNTANIIRQYEEEYPDIIKPIYQKENQYSKGAQITKEFLLPKARGKYIAWCEGDDYWCDEGKLQKQVEILERYTECSICTHLVQHIQENGEIINGTYPPFQLEKGVIPKEKILSYIIKDRYFLFQFSSFLVRYKDYFEYCNTKLIFKQKSAVGDTPLIFYMMTKGNLYYLDIVCSCYRLFSNDSWTSKVSNNIEKLIDFYTKKIESIKAYNDYTDLKYNDMIETYIIYYEMELLVLTKNYRKMFKLKYRKELKARYNYKERCALALFSISPAIEKIYILKRGKKSEK